MQYRQRHNDRDEKGRVELCRPWKFGGMSKTRYAQIMRTFAARLRTAREAAGYVSAQRFAALLGVEPHTYRKYERGDSEPNFDVLLRICELLDVEASYLLPVKKGGSSSMGSSQDAAA